MFHLESEIYCYLAVIVLVKYVLVISIVISIA